MSVLFLSKATHSNCSCIKKQNNVWAEDSYSDSAFFDIGLTCQHVSKAVDLSSVKKAVTSCMWSTCSDCLRERTLVDGVPTSGHDILVCLKCGFQGCNQSESQHSTKHHQTLRPETHCISISLSTWKAWCFECNEELSTHCNKMALAQTLDFLQKHSVKAASASKVIKPREEPGDYTDQPRGKSPVNSTLVPVKGINNLGNTCFFNAVMQNLSQTHMLNDLIQDVKEKGHKLKIVPPSESNVGPLTVTLPSPEPLTSAMFLFLHSMKELGKGPVNPKILFNQLCQKAPRFKGYQQQDSQELLHYLLDSLRVEETKRIKASILKSFNNPTEKTADAETKRQVKAYGKEGVRMNFVDRIFVGELTNTIMCEECLYISHQKQQPCKRSPGLAEERGTDGPSDGPEQDSPSTMSHTAGASKMAANSLSDGSEKDSGPQDSSNDADSEASESEWTPRSLSAHCGRGSTQSPAPLATPSVASLDPQQVGAVEQLVTAVHKMNIGPALVGAHSTEEQGEPHQQHPHHQGAFQALSHSYTPCSKECSVQSCLHQFTSVELLMGNNKLLCESCTERRQKQLRKSSSAEKKTEKVYTSARKQMLISILPPVVTLHLKRFHQAGMNVRKVNRHVDFPLILDLAPFCSASCKNLAAGDRVLYSLYGIVEHSGSMRGGHYTAYVKVRSPQRRASLHITMKTFSEIPEASSTAQGQWVYVSDTNVQAVPESRVLNSQAYLLFYEEVL
uniref:Ubiquitin carboxyl-terminal hydrolase n=1 Tax=Esox lucius TaxID=8010 RepID=A0A6Q2Y9Y5_ESOLU